MALIVREEYLYLNNMIVIGMKRNLKADEATWKTSQSLAMHCL